MAKKSISRKQMLKEPDEFITTSSRFIEWLMTYKAHVSRGICVVLGVIALISAVRYTSRLSENKAFTALEKEMQVYQKAVEEDGPKKAFEEAGGAFQDIISDYSGKQAAKLAKLTYAGMAYDAGNFEKAVNYYAEVTDEINDYPSLKNFVLSGLARAYEGKKEYASAVKYFEMIAQGNSPLLKSEAFFKLGCLYDRLGEAEKSLKAFETVVSEYSDSFYKNLASARIVSS